VDCAYNRFGSAETEGEHGHVGKKSSGWGIKEMLRRSGGCDGVRGHGCGVGH
jgi:hypothetical protein